MKEAVIFGAGNIGRGFIGQLFSESGYRITFVDIDQSLLAALNQQGRYTIRLVTNNSSDEVGVGPVFGLLADNRAAVAQAVAKAEIAATAVGARVLEYIAPNVATGIICRADQGIKAPLNLLICENLKNAAHIFANMVKTALPPSYHPYLATHIGFVDTVIARMIPPLSDELRVQDPGLIIVEPYKELPVDAVGFVGSVPDIWGAIPATEFSFYTERKLYVHNAGHAVLGYFGYRRGYSYGYEALLDPEISGAVRGAMKEAQQALERKYGLASGALSAYVEDLLTRFGNRTLGDTIFRLGRDPIRKLAHNDRLIGAALTALGYGVEPTYLVRGIIAALQFDPTEDPAATTLQSRLQQVGLEPILQEVCGLEPASPLAQLIQDRFQ